MKNYARLFVLTLAAVFVFAACDSSGGGDPNPPRVEPVSYVSTTGSQETIELILNYSAAAAQKSPARRASALPQTGTYILKFEGAEKSRGRYQMNGTSMAFQSDGGKSFTAAVGNANEDRRAISFPDPVPLDTGGADLSIPPMKEDYSFRILGQQVVDRNGDSLGSGTITLYAMTDYSTDDWTKTDRTPLGAPVGTITNGKLKLTLPELASNADYGFYKSRSVAYFYIDNDPKKIVCLELLKKNKAIMPQCTPHN